MKIRFPVRFLSRGSGKGGFFQRESPGTDTIEDDLKFMMKDMRSKDDTARKRPGEGR